MVIQSEAIVEATTRHPCRVPADGEQLAGAILVRCAMAHDRSKLERLAELDSTEPPSGPTVIAEVRGYPVAALSLRDGKVVADPFFRTEDAVALLRFRAKQLRPRKRFRLPRPFRRR